MTDPFLALAEHQLSAPTKRRLEARERRSAKQKKTEDRPELTSWRKATDLAFLAAFDVATAREAQGLAPFDDDLSGALP